jgi:O-antigen ligase
MNKLTEILIFATVFLIPSYLIRFNIFGVPTNVLEILIYSTFVSHLFEKPAIKWKELYENYKTYIFSIALIFIGLILSTLANQNYREGFGIIKGWFFDPILFSFILINKIKEQRDIENILKTFYFSAFSISLIALEYFFYGHLTYDGRLEAFYSSPNYLAMFLAPSVFIGLYLFKIQSASWRTKFKIQNFVIPVTLLLISFIIYFTHSYAIWISIILSLLIIGFITKKLNKKILATSALIVFVAFLTQINNPKLKDIFSERSSLSSRIMIWESSVLMIKNDPIFGIGPGNFQNKYLEYQKYFSPYLEWAVPQPHNLYLAFCLQGGIIGLTGFIILVATWLKKTAKKILSNQKNSAVLAVSLGIVIYILFHGIFDTTYWKNDLALIFWIIIFLL